MDIFELGETIREARRSAGMTQEQLAKASGVSRVRVVQLETGTAMDMQMSNVLRLLGALGLELQIAREGDARPSFEEIMARRDELYDTPGMG